jgi:two-component system sensor histidine kinase YesM
MIFRCCQSLITTGMAALTVLKLRPRDRRMKLALRLRTIADSIRRYRFNSLFVRIYALILGLVIVPLLASSLAVYTSVRSLLERQVVSLQESNIARVQDVLDTISREIDKLAIRLTGIDNEVSDALVALSKLLKLGLDSDSPIVPLEREVEHARLYADMQKLRYKDKFDVAWDVAEDARACRTVKILLQPLIENAIYHGIKPLEGRGTIAVAARRRGRDLVLRVQDDGVGMQAGAVAELNANLENRFREAHAHIGLHNVNQRIKLLFGEPYGIRVESGEGKGFAVEVTLPALEENG